MDLKCIAGAMTRPAIDIMTGDKSNSITQSMQQGVRPAWYLIDALRHSGLELPIFGVELWQAQIPGSYKPTGATRQEGLSGDAMHLLCEGTPERVPSA